jgi:hypothetical protein
MIQRNIRKNFVILSRGRPVVKDLGESATKTAMDVKDLGETATKA